MMSRCAQGLAEICSYGKRRFWLKWPELLDEIYSAAEDVLTSNTQLSRYFFSLNVFLIFPNH